MGFNTSKVSICRGELGRQLFEIEIQSHKLTYSSPLHWNPIYVTGIFETKYTFKSSTIMSSNRRTI